MARSLAVVTLLAGREATLPLWQEFMLLAELPPETARYVVDNSGNPEFGSRLQAACREIASARSLAHLDVTISGSPHKAARDEDYGVRGRNLHIARLYGCVLPRVVEDMVLTLEDDIQPPHDAARRLGETVGCTS